MYRTTDSRLSPATTGETRGLKYTTPSSCILIEMPVVPRLVDKKEIPALNGTGGTSSFSQHLVYSFPSYVLDGITDGHSL